MPLKVGELFATMRLENKDFDKALDESGRRFSKLGDGIKQGVAASAKVFTATTTAALGLGAAALKTGLDYNRMQQTSRAALLAILGSTEAVNAQMAELDEFASKSPFSKQVFLQAQQQMLGFGIEAKKVVPYLDAIQNATAAVGGSNQDIAEIVNIFSKIQGASKITAENLNELGYRGIDAAAIIGSSMGKTAEEIRSEITAGTLDAGVALDALAAGMQSKFGGATDNIKQQMDGAADRVKAAWRDIGSVMATPLIDPTSGGQLVEWTNLFADGLRAVQGQAKVLVPMLWDRLGPGVDFVTTSLQKATGVITGWNARSLETSLDKISKYAPLIAGTSAALFALGSGNIRILQLLGLGGINPVVAGLAALVAFSPQLRGVAGDLLAAFQPAITPVKELAVVVADFLLAALDAATPALGDLATAGGDVAVLFLSMLVPAVKAGTEILLPLIAGGANLVSMFTRLPTPILATVAAFAAMKALGLGGVFNGLLQQGIKPALAGMRDFVNATRLMSTEMGAARTGLALAGQAAGAFGNALKLAFISNAPMLALTAIVGALTFFSQKSAEAAARADSYAQALDGLTGSAEDTTAALEKVAKNNLVTGENMDWGWYQKWNTGFKTAADAVQSLGIELDDFTGAMAGSDTEFNAMVARLEEMKRAAGPEATSVYDELITKLHQQRNAMSEAERQMAQMTSETERAEKAQAAYSDVLKTAAEAVDRLRSAEASLAAAKGDLVMAQYAATDALADWVSRVSEAGGVQRDQNGELTRSGDAWRAFEEGAIKSRSALDTVLDNMIKTGASQAELDEKLESSKAQWVSQAESMGLSTAEAEAYWEALGGIPEKVSTQVDLGTDPATAALDKLLSEIQNSHGEMVIDASSSPAHAELLRTLGLVEVSEGQFSLDANSDPATAELLMTLGVVNTSTGILTMDANNKPSIDRLRESEKTINGTTGTMTIAGRDRTGSVRDEAVRRANAAVGTMSISARDNATATARSIVAQIDRMRGTITIGAIATGAAAQASIHADGGVRYFAGGSENHIAQIARPGEWRVWAEPETGGEAYIPLAMSKRQRSLAILDHVAQEFGFALVGTGARSFADGSAGPRQIASATSGLAGITIGQLVVDISKVRTLAELEAWVQGLGLDLTLADIR